MYDVWATDSISLNNKITNCCSDHLSTLAATTIWLNLNIGCSDVRLGHQIMFYSFEKQNNERIKELDHIVHWMNWTIIIKIEKYWLKKNFDKKKCRKGRKTVLSVIKYSCELQSTPLNTVRWHNFCSNNNK